MSEKESNLTPEITPIKVELSRDERTAWLVTEKEHTYSVPDLEKALSDAGVVMGLNREKLSKAASGKRLLPSEPIAKAIPPQQGKPAQLRYLIYDETKPHIRENGSYDFRELNLVKNVKAGDLLIRKIPPTVGDPGFTVTGKEIPGKKGKDIKLGHYSGPGTKIAGEQSDCIIANTDGVYKLHKNGSVSVLALLTINSDIDYNTGNIHSISNLLINGDIKSGFEVESKGDLTVHGLIENAKVKVNGDLHVVYGLTQGDSSIDVKGELKALYIYGRSNVKAGSLIVKEMVSNSKIVVAGDARAEKIVGGELVAKGNINVIDTGYSMQETKTVLIAGLDLGKIKLRSELKSKLEEKQAEFLKLDDEYGKLKTWAAEFKQDSAKLMRDLAQIEKLAISDKIKSEIKSKLNRLNKCSSEIKDLEMQIADLKSEIEDLCRQLANPKAKITISGTVFAGVRIAIGESETITILEPEKKVTFQLDADGKIVRSKN